MAGYVQLSSGFWTSTLDWPASAKLLYLWLWSNTNCNGLTGIGPADHRLASPETGLDKRAYNRAIKMLQDDGHVVVIDGWAWVVARAKHTLERGRNEKLLKSAARFLEEAAVPHELGEAFWEVYGGVFEEAGVAVRREPSARRRKETAESQKQG